MAPEYAMHGYLTEKADVYSFGVVALEIVSGKHNTMSRPKDECFCIVDWVNCHNHNLIFSSQFEKSSQYLEAHCFYIKFSSKISFNFYQDVFKLWIHIITKIEFHVYQVHLLKEEGNIMDLVDERLGEDFEKEEVMVMINVALLCTHVSPMHRPTMSSVVSMLEGNSVVEEVVSDTSQVFEGKKLEMIQQYYQQNENNVTPEEESILIDATAEYMSDTNLHSINMDSPYRSFNTL